MSRRFGEMEPAPARKREDRFDDDRAMLPDQPFARCQIEAVKDNQRAAGTGAACQIGRIDPAIKPGPVKGKIGTILLELPTEGGGKKGPRRRHIRRGKLDIIDLVMGEPVIADGILMS